jgi:hypothetical protein
MVKKMQTDEPQVIFVAGNPDRDAIQAEKLRPVQDIVE